MKVVYPPLEHLEREEQRRSGIESSDVYYLPAARRFGGLVHDDKTIQKMFVEHAIFLLGDDAWLYGAKHGGSVRKLKDIYHQLKVINGYNRLPYKTFYDWFHHYLRFGETKAESKRRQRRIRMRLRGKRATRVTSFTIAEQLALKAIADNSPHLFLDEIQLIMRRKFGKSWHTATLWREMYRQGYSLQKAVFYARQRSENLRQEFRVRRDGLLLDPRMAIWVDETHKSANESRRRRGWAKRSNPPVVEAYFEEDFRKRYTLIGAGNYKGFVTNACKLVEREHGRNDTNPDRGTINTTRFEEYVEENLCPELGNYLLGEPNSVVFMDNATIHISERVIKLIEAKGAKLVFTAPYSPDLNPIEFFFSVYKAALKRYTYSEGLDWKGAHDLALEAMTMEKALNFYKKAEVPLKDLEPAKSSLKIAVAISAAFVTMAEITENI